MAGVHRSRLVFLFIIFSLIIMSCELGDLFGPLSRYSSRLQTQESHNATRTAFEATVSYLESQISTSNNEPAKNSEISEPEQVFSEYDAVSGSEPVSGLAGTWEYHYISETTKAHMYTMTIKWDGQVYQVTNCTYISKDGSCQIQNQSWDGTTFSFTLHFPHTNTTTVHTLTGVTGNTLIGTRYNEQFGSGDIVWSRTQ